MDPVRPPVLHRDGAREPGSDDRGPRDADEILVRAATDEAAADAARARYRSQSMPSLPPDARIGPLLTSDERVLAVRQAAILERRQTPPGTLSPPGLEGSLYVTTRRLILVGRLTLAYELDTIEEAVLSGERLLLVLCDGQGLALEVAQPRLLRVELSAARSAAKV